MKKNNKQNILYYIALIINGILVGIAMYLFWKEYNF